MHQFPSSISESGPGRMRSLEALRIHFEDRKLQRRPAPSSSESSWNRKNEERVQSSLEACVKDDAADN
ncbi:hypothetical protein SDJN02_13337, partial [Cucurbita argyrosperma subsp. argyrosperma]